MTREQRLKDELHCYQGISGPRRYAVPNDKSSLNLLARYLDSRRHMLEERKSGYKDSSDPQQLRLNATEDEAWLEEIRQAPLRPERDWAISFAEEGVEEKPAKLARLEAMASGGLRWPKAAMVRTACFIACVLFWAALVAAL